MRTSKLLPNTDPKLPIEDRLFEIALFVTVVFFLFWTVYGISIGYTLIIRLIYGFGFLFYLLFYILYKWIGSFKWFAAVYYTSIIGLLAFSWLPAGGIDGPIMYWFFLAYMSGLLVLPLGIYLVFLVSSILIVGYLGWLEVTNPGIAVLYDTTLLRLKDLQISSIVTLLILGFAMFIFKKAYLGDREKMKELIAELERQKIKAESADRAKTQFLATISHEMRTPLNGVVGITELIQKTGLTQEQQEMVHNLSYSSKQLHSIISDVLDLTLIEDNKLIINQREINIQEEISNIITIINPRVISKSENLVVSYVHDSSIPHVVLGDDIRFRQILINLVNNAVKFTHDGMVLVKTEMVRKQGNTVWIFFTVRDTGVGIPLDRQGQIFTKFYKANTDSRAEGTGLGLSICRHLVELMKGYIGFQSTPGKGSEFYFELPFEVSTRATPIRKEEQDCNLQGLRVLLVEDTPINQMVAKKMLTNIGVKQLEIAENGRIAVEMCSHSAYDFVLMDLQMPEMNGIEACKHILERMNGTPPIIIAVTANVMTTDLEECKEAGMKDFISKPFQAETLRSVMCKHLKG